MANLVTKRFCPTPVPGQPGPAWGFWAEDEPISALRTQGRRSHTLQGCILRRKRYREYPSPQRLNQTQGLQHKEFNYCTITRAITRFERRDVCKEKEEITVRVAHSYSHVSPSAWICHILKPKGITALLAPRTPTGGTVCSAKEKNSADFCCLEQIHPQILQQRSI